MLKGSFIALAGDFGVAGGAAFFMAGAGDCADADFVGVCAIAADGTNTIATAAKQITDSVE